MLDFITWTADPAIFSIGSREIRWYGLAFAIGFLIGYKIVEKMWKREKLNPAWIDSLLIYTMVGTVVGARLGHCLFYDPGYYLGHLFNGKKSKLGCLFSLKSSDYRQPSQNIAIYGHHLSHSDAMFSTLIDYKQEAYYAEHSVITLDSIYGRRSYRIFAVLNMKVSDWDPAAASFGNGKAFLQFVNRAKRKALFNTGVEVKENDHILTLITCDRSYSGASGRLIVMAVQE